MMDSKCLCLDQEDLDQYNLMLDIVEADMKLRHAVIEMIVIINDLVSIKSKYKYFYIQHLKRHIK